MTAIYARQSIEKKDSISIESQIEFCKRECDGEFTIYQDVGFSGKNINRPSFEKMMSDIKEGNINKVVCYRLDRISRSITDFGSVWETLSSANVEFVSVNEKFDTSAPVGRAMLYIIMVFAQLERETIAERVKDNYYQRVKNGGWGGGVPPYGFKIVKNSGNKNATLEVTKDMNVPIRIFEMYAQPGTSLGTIARTLTSEGIKGPQREQWDTITVNRLLRNPAYAKCNADIYRYFKHKGAIIHNDVADFDGTKGAYLVGKRQSNDRKYKDISDNLFALSSHDGVIDSDIFIQCQEKLDTNKQVKNTGKGKYTWLSGLIKCGDCGYSLKISLAKEQLYIICTGRTNLKVCAQRHSRKIHEVEAYVEAEIRRYVGDLREEDAAQNSADQNPIKLEILKIDEKISNLIAGIAESNSIVMSYINAEMIKLENQKYELESKLYKKSANFKFNLRLLEFDTLNFDLKKELARIIIKKVLITNECIKIEWNPL